MERMMYEIFDFLWGRFGRKKLVKKYRVWWQRFWIAVFVALFILGMIRFLEWWDGVVRFLNYVIWG
nr:MAG TPA: hypothetical protein [Herelleviridae sp.]